MIQGLTRRLVELHHYRELVRNLVIRDLKVRYKNSMLGVLWSLLNPLLMTVVFTVVFTLMVPTSEVEDFPVWFMCGFLPWSFLSASLTGATASIVNNASLIKKVYFPREILPISVVISNLINFLLALVVLFAMILVFGRPLRATFFLLPLVMLTQLFFVAGVAFFLSTANVFYRDTQHILEIGLQAWFFLTPIFYPITILPSDAHVLGTTINIQLWVRRLNPMASLVATYREVLYWGVPSGADFFLRTLVECVVILVVGYLFFCRYSRLFGEEA